MQNTKHIWCLVQCKKVGLAKWLLDEIVSGNYMLLKNVILLEYYCYKMKLWCKENTKRHIFVVSLG